MPRVEKQTSTETKNGRAQIQTSKSDDALADAVLTGDIADDFVKMCIYGVNRIGKTTLSCQFPKPLLHVSFEPNASGGAKSIKKIPGVVHVKALSSGKAEQICQQLQENGGLVPEQLRKEAGGSKFLSYVVDGATSLQDVVLKEIMGWDDISEQINMSGLSAKEKMDRYQDRAEKTKTVLRNFIRLPGNVVVLAKEKDHNPPKDDYASVNKLRGGLTIESFFAEDVGGGVAGWLHDACDQIIRLYLAKETTLKSFTVAGKTTQREVETGKTVRRALTTLQPNFAAGFRSDNPDAVPEFIEARTPQEMYLKIMKAVRGEK